MSNHPRVACARARASPHTCSSASLTRLSACSGTGNLHHNTTLKVVSHLGRGKLAADIRATGRRARQRARVVHPPGGDPSSQPRLRASQRTPPSKELESVTNALPTLSAGAGSAADFQSAHPLAHSAGQPLLMEPTSQNLGGRRLRTRMPHPPSRIRHNSGGFVGSPTAPTESRGMQNFAALSHHRSGTSPPGPFPPWTARRPRRPPTACRWQFVVAAAFAATAHVRAPTKWSCGHCHHASSR